MKALHAGYTSCQVPVPDWITDGMEILEREVRRRTEDELKRQKAQLVTELEALKSREEKKAEKVARLAALEARLAGKVSEQ